MLRNSPQTYGRVHIALHWLTALTTLGLFALGIWMVGLDYYDRWYNRAPHVHKSIGVLLFFLVALRLLWRWTNPRPRPFGSAREIRLAEAAHRILYLLLFTVALSGYLIPTADGRALDVFDWFSLPATLHGIARQEDIAGEIHEGSAFALIGLVVLHAGAALKHHFLDRDRTLARMLGLGPANFSDNDRSDKERP
jgi:cytochrome b561